jgi:hypothetical protein
MMNHKDFFESVRARVCDETDTDPDDLFSSNKESHVEARCLLVSILSKHGYTDTHLSGLTGLTRQAVNKLRNSLEDRLRHSWRLRQTEQRISSKTEIDKQRTIY